RLDHRVHEALDAELEDLELEGFLRFEVREEAALGKLQLFGQPADREPLEADAARHPGRMLEDGLAGEGAFPEQDSGHATGPIIARSFVLVKPAARRTARGRPAGRHRRPRASPPEPDGG